MNYLTIIQFNYPFMCIILTTAGPNGREINACTVFDGSNTGTVGSNPARGMDVCVCPANRTEQSP